MILNHVFGLDFPKVVDHIFYDIVVRTIESCECQQIKICQYAENKFI